MAPSSLRRMRAASTPGRSWTFDLGGCGRDEHSIPAWPCALDMKRNRLTHLDEAGRARMVDVTDKLPTARMARAEASVWLGRSLANLLRRKGSVSKGNVLETARLAGIMGAKQTSQLIPLCHPLALDVVEVHTEVVGDRVVIETLARTRGSTGVEMEALTAASVAALTVYDMCKAASKDLLIGPIRLLEKSGGRSGHWQAKETKRGRKG